jgi:hypothetical protein
LDERLVAEKPELGYTEGPPPRRGRRRRQIGAGVHGGLPFVPLLANPFPAQGPQLRVGVFTSRRHRIIVARPEARCVASRWQLSAREGYPTAAPSVIHRLLRLAYRRHVEVGYPQRRHRRPRRLVAPLPGQRQLAGAHL